jgi:hypothetical protein
MASSAVQMVALNGNEAAAAASHAGRDFRVYCYTTAVFAVLTALALYVMAVFPAIDIA